MTDDSKVQLAELRVTVANLNNSVSELKGYLVAGAQYRLDTTTKLAVIEKSCKDFEVYQKECTTDRAKQTSEISTLRGEVKSQVRIAAVFVTLLGIILPGAIEWFRR